MANRDMPVPFDPAWPEANAEFFGVEIPDPPRLDLEMILSPRWAQAIRTDARSRSTPVDYVFGSALAVNAGLIGNTRWAAPTATWQEPPMLWCALVGASGATKSPAMDIVLGPLSKLETRLQEQARKEHCKWQEKAQVAKVFEKVWRDDVKAAAVSGDTPPKKPSKADPGPEPHMPQPRVADATIEKLIAISSKQPRGVLCVRDELAGWFHGLTRYSASSDRPYWLEGYGGRKHVSDRMSRGTHRVERFSVGLLGGIQPDVLGSTMLGERDDDGLLARFLPFYPEPVAYGGMRDDPPDPLWEEVTDKLWSLEMEGNDPVFVPFDAEAREKLDRFIDDKERQRKEVDGRLVSFLGKARGSVVRLALVIALMRWASGERGHVDTITVDDVHRAILLYDEYLFPMACRTYGGPTRPEETAARSLYELIIGWGKANFTVREVQQKRRRLLKYPKEIRGACQVLQEAGIVRRLDALPSSKGGRPSERYVVNPAVLPADKV